MTLLGTHHRLHEDILAAARHDVALSFVGLELTALPRINAEQGHLAGDRTIEHAARRSRHAAARVGGTAYRWSGRRFGILVPARGRPVMAGLADEVQTEFLDGPEVAVVEVVREPGEAADALLGRARAALRDGG
jgi:GGDEF domain-containing protein